LHGLPARTTVRSGWRSESRQKNALPADGLSILDNAGVKIEKTGWNRGSPPGNSNISQSNISNSVSYSRAGS